MNKANGQNAWYNTWAVPCLLALGMVLRMIYAWDLPLGWDERVPIGLAQAISFDPDSFFVPLGSRQTSHPMFSVYLTALGLKLGDGSLFFTRMIFVYLSIAGLLGLYMLALALFGERTAIIALALGAIDRYLISTSPMLFGSACHLFALCWVALFFWNAVEKGRESNFLYMGALLGVAYMFYELSLLLIPGFVLYAVLFSHTKKILSSKFFYLGILIFFAIASTSIAWNLANSHSNYLRAYARAGGLGLSPRVFLLYAGDLFTTFADPFWMIFERGGQMYIPCRVPCLPLTGLVYLICMGLSLRFVKERPYAFAALLFFPVAIIVSVLNPADSWNNFWWAGSTVFFAIAVTAAMADKLAGTKRRTLMCLGGAVFMAGIIAFLAGPKSPYPALCAEKRYIGQMYTLYHCKPYNNPADKANARLCTEKFLARHPKSTIGHYYRSVFAQNKTEFNDAIKRAMELAPDNPLILMEKAKNSAKKLKWEEAEAFLKAILASGHNYHAVHQELAMTELFLENYHEAEKHFEIAIRIKPDHFGLYGLLSVARDGTGDHKGAQQAFETFKGIQFNEPWQAYKSLSEILDNAGMAQKAHAYQKKAHKLRSGLPLAPRSPETQVFQAEDRSGE